MGRAPIGCRQILLLLALCLVGTMAAAEPSGQPDALSPEQREALVALIRNLEILQSGSTAAIADSIGSELARTEGEVRQLDEQLSGLRDRINAVERQRQALLERSQALRIGQVLLADRNATPPAALARPGPSPEAEPDLADTSIKPLPPDGQPKNGDDPGVVFFQQSVRPVLEAQCFRCHGGEFRRGGFDLTTRDSLLAGGDSGPAVVAGDAEGSLLYRLITHAEQPHMPQRADKLSGPAIAAIVQWIESGAPYDRPLSPPIDQAAEGPGPATHWAFRPPQRPPVPPVTASNRVRNPIDAFVLARLEAEGVALSPEADRHTLIRRLSLDLLGLPPAPEEVDEFVHDAGPDAYGRLVDRLLASPHFGERWARHWLDLARYADSDGYEKDGVRPYAWRWRDWVIDALNQDMPFDQFTLEQLAGDLLPDATVEQKVATGFHRNTLTNREGGVDQEEFRLRAVVDRVNTTGEVWLGLTLGCAECHSHKYDPITQREYYQMLAFFNTSREVDLPAPLPRESEEAAAERQRFEGIREELTAALAAYERDELPVRQAEWERSVRGPSVEWTPLEPRFASSAGGATVTPQPDHSLFVEGEQPATDTYVISAWTDMIGITAVRLEVLADDRLPSRGPGRIRHGNFVLSEFKVQAASTAEPGSQASIKLERAEAVHSQEKWPVADAVDGNTSTGWAIAPRMGQDHVAVFEASENLGFADGTILTFVLDQQYRNHTIGRLRLSVTSEPRPVQIQALPPELVETLQVEPAERTVEQAERLASHYRSIDVELLKRRKALEAHAANEPKPPMAQTLAENPEPPKTYIHLRGDFLSKGDEVGPGTPAILNPLVPRGERPDRVDLARWLTSPENPLTARVAVNRIWQHLFGQGLAATAEDFGTRSDPPSHPELLDWLAAEMIARGWSQKAMIRLIVESATYRQSSHARPDLWERDPRNTLLARQNRFRLDAEAIRDSSLAASGLLHPVIGGPSIRPPLPPDVAALGYAGSVKWEESPAPDRYRRGMYIFFQRTVPYPMLMTFDAPDSNVACVRRERSNTPLQALTLLNAPDFFECAQSLGLDTMRQADTPPERIRHLFRRVVCREPDSRELDRLVELWKDISALYREDADAAALMTNEPEVKRLSGGLPDAAAWVAVARTIMNLDEFMTRE